MSARQRFVANGRPASNQMDDTDGSGAAMTSGTPAAPDRHNTSSAPALKDASNSPRPGRRTARNSIQINKDEMDVTTSHASQISNAILAAAGIDKPLNIGALARPKTKKAGDHTATPNQNKKHRNATVERLKENDPKSYARSLKTLPMSPSRRPQSSGPPSSFLFSSSIATLLEDSQPMSPSSRQKQSTRTSDPSDAHTPNDSQRYSRIPVSQSGNSFAASGHTLMNAFSPSASRSFHEPLEPARREVFPMRTNSDGPTEPTHTHDSLSPPTPAQRRFSEERTYDYQVPVILDEGDGQADEDVLHRHDQRLLRRMTKRIGQHDTEEEESAHGREGKRTKIDTHSKEIIDEPHTDITYEQRRTRPSRSSTPVQRYQSAAQTNGYDVHSHQSQSAHSRLESHAQNPPQLTPPAPLGEDNQALCRLLEIDLEQYVSEHVEQYEAAKKRWTGCSIEEWQAGANEMSGKFGKLLDFAKDHMTTKLALYASLHEKVTQHKVILGERQSMLKNMQEKLVKDSGMVLGGGGRGAT